jgi:transcriptional regulator with XRE-family HTH domain
MARVVWVYGQFLREIRVSRQLSQSQLAAVVGIDQPNLSAYEQDRRMPSLATVSRIAAACGYQLYAQAGEARVRCPLPDEDTWRPDPPLLGDPSDQPPVLSVGARPAERGVALEALLGLAEATREPG